MRIHPLGIMNVRSNLGSWNLFNNCWGQKFLPATGVSGKVNMIYNESLYKMTLQSSLLLKHCHEFLNLVQLFSLLWTFFQDMGNTDIVKTAYGGKQQLPRWINWSHLHRELLPVQFTSLPK